MPRYDRRGYTTVPVREGYGQWMETYEETVEDVMNLRLLDSCGQNTRTHFIMAS
jgi:hypothetical protein